MENQSNLNELEQFNKEIRTKALGRMKKRTPQQLSGSWFNDDLLYSGIGKTVYIIVPTPGCSWALGDSGGCTMCSYISDCTLEPVDDNEIFELFKDEFEKYELVGQTAVKIFASGSFLNPLEVSINVRNNILKYLGENEFVSEVIVESRPEYVDESTIDDVFSFLGNKLFEISIGLESSNDFTREEKINKGFSKKDFERVINLINSLKNKYNIKSKAYSLVKPILTNEKEAIDEAIETAKYCGAIGVDRISFTPTTIHRGTLVEQLWRRGAYQPPWIWTTVEIINSVRNEIAIPSFMDTSGFGSRRGPYNCKKCNKELKHRIIDSNLNQSLIEYECDCKGEWKAIVSNADLNKSKTFIRHLPLV
ncbi:MAG: archaeosine biosynthesis radical SAM protein RaSEA [Methanobrevibacter sp.]|jgi:radical SAM enzyme (TIGR01210 family)|nr:archaeosine biosynthesis radical SAM protein RaSEA [Candidatus Methanoflexus mossambicus]